MPHGGMVLPSWMCAPKFNDVLSTVVLTPDVLLQREDERAMNEHTSQLVPNTTH